MAKKKRGEREAERKREAFHASQQRLGRRRTIVGLLGIVPFAASLVCGAGTPLEFLCVLPQSWWLLVWAALFGSFLGLTIRLVLERRRFERGTQGGRAA